MPVDSQEQTSRVLKLLEDRQVPMEDVLHAVYGEWPVKGLDIVGRNPQIVTLVETPEYYASLDLPVPMRDGAVDWPRGVASIQGKRMIGLTRSFRDGTPVHLSLAHESAHVLQGDYSHRVAEMFDPHHPMTQAYLASLGGDMPCTDVGLHLARYVDAGNPITTEENYRYLLDGSEIAARVAEVVAKGYPAWGRMPLNLEELQIALYCDGVEPLPHNTASSTLNQTFAVFGKPVEGKGRGASADLTKLLSGLTAEGKTVFWNDTLPRLYSDLIEMYGDRLGRSRFGLGVNLIAALREHPIALPQEEISLISMQALDPAAPPAPSDVSIATAYASLAAPQTQGMMR